MLKKEKFKSLGFWIPQSAKPLPELEDNFEKNDPLCDVPMTQKPLRVLKKVLEWVFHDLISSIRPSREPRLVSYLPSPPRVLTVFSTLNSFLSLLHTDHFPSLHETGLDATLPSVLSLFSNPAIFILLLSLAFYLKYNCISLYCFYSVNFNTSKRF